ncbi:MAG: manganese transporter [Gemmatales bacterium]|nr:MAG: manganese transporter [Gemmatales bacterium]
MRCLLSGLVLLVLASVVAAQPKAKKLKVVVTTGQIEDAVKNVADDLVELHALMGPGVDPHEFEPTQRHIELINSADLYLVNGLHLEGKMGGILKQHPDKGVAVTDGIPREKLRRVEGFEGGYDPHVWFDVMLWKDVVQYIADTLSKRDPVHKETYQKNAKAYLAKLDKLDEYIQTRAAEIPSQRRKLVTAHDAFGYFGRRYGFEVVGLQGVSTEGEAGTADVVRLADFIVKHQVPAIFVETSVADRHMQAVVEAVAARGYEVVLAAEQYQLYSDAMGPKGTPEGTYEGMMRHNIDTIVEVMKNPLAAKREKNRWYTIAPIAVVVVLVIGLGILIVARKR